MIDHQDRNLILLGPQPQYLTLKRVLSKLPRHGPIGMITAGWETDEREDHALRQAIDGEVINLNLFQRTEHLFQKDPELIGRLQDRQDELRHVRDVYNERLKQLCKSARRLFHRNDPLIDFHEERQQAVDMIRQLDRQHFQHATRIIEKYELELQIGDRPLVREHRDQLADILNGCGILLISGGHVAIIVNRLRIFGIFERTPDIPIIAWSGGAMALAEQIVFFHDSLPQGLNDAEVLRPGMGVYQSILPLPDARHRLKLDDPVRVELFSRRFQDFQCVVFDQNTLLQRHQRQWRDYTDGGAVGMGCEGTLVHFSV